MPDTMSSVPDGAKEFRFPVEPAQEADDDAAEALAYEATLKRYGVKTLAEVEEISSRAARADEAALNAQADDPAWQKKQKELRDSPEYKQYLADN